MKQRVLGNGQKVSAIGLGCMGMDHAYGKPADRQDMIRLIHRALENGCNFFDTAVIYGKGNEEVLGNALSSMREKAVIATKFGITGQVVKNGRLENLLDSSPQSIRAQLEGSLSRLKTDYIDLYYQHRVDPNVEPEVVASTMKDLMAEGKIKGWGLSNAQIDYLKRAHAVCPLAAIENQYSMVFREPEKELFSLCESLNIAFVAYSPLGNGFLSTRYQKDTEFGEGDYRRFMGRFQPNVFDNNKPLLDFLKSFALQKNITPAQLVLAWELAQKPFIIPIPGTTKENRLLENLDASNIEFTQEEWQRIDDNLQSFSIDETHF